MRVLSCRGRVPDMLAQACCTPRIATAMRANGESIMNIRMTTLRGAGRGDHSVSMSAACVALPGCDAASSDGVAGLHSTGTSLLCSKTSLLFSKTNMLLPKASLLPSEASLLCAETSLLCSEASLIRSKASLFCSETSLLRSEASLLPSETPLLCSKASLFRSETWIPTRHSTIRRAAARMACVMRGRRAARSPGSHAKVPAPHWRSTVFK